LKVGHLKEQELSTGRILEMNDPGFLVLSGIVVRENKTAIFEITLEI